MKTALLIALTLTLLAFTARAQDAKPDDALRKKVDALVQKLGDKDWKTRNAATDELLKIGKPALPQLDAALKHADEEIRHRAAALVAAIKGQNNQAAKPAGAALKDALAPLLGKEGGTVVLDGNGGVTIMGGEGGIITVEAKGDTTIITEEGIISTDARGAVTQAVGVNNRQAARKAAAVRVQINQLLADALIAKMNAGGQGGVITANEDGTVTIIDHAEGGIKQLDAQGDVIQEAVPPQIEEGVIVQGQGVIIINGAIVQGGFGAAPQPNLPAGAAVAADLLDTFGAKLAEAEGGLRCTDVKVGTPADKLGLQVGDLITKVAGRDATKLDDVKEFLLKPDPEKPLKLEVTRKGESHTLTAPAK
jgi:hypothetical protein